MQMEFLKMKEARENPTEDMQSKIIQGFFPNQFGNSKLTFVIFRL